MILIFCTSIWSIVYLGLGFVAYWIWVSSPLISNIFESWMETFLSAGHGAKNWWHSAILPMLHSWATWEISSYLTAWPLGFWATGVSPLLPILLLDFCAYKRSPQSCCLFLQKAASLRSAMAPNVSAFLSSTSVPPALGFWNTGRYLGFLTVLSPCLQTLVIKNPDSFRWPPWSTCSSLSFWQLMGGLGGCFRDIPSSLFS